MYLRQKIVEMRQTYRAIVLIDISSCNNGDKLGAVLLGGQVLGEYKPISTGTFRVAGVTTVGCPRVRAAIVVTGKGSATSFVRITPGLTASAAGTIVATVGRCQSFRRSLRPIG